MKSNKRKNKSQWYVVFDGKNMQITNNITEAKTLNVVIVEITADEAAQMLTLIAKGKEGVAP